MLDDQDVVGLLLGDQELGVVALGVHRVRGDHAPGQAQGLQQWRERGDLVGLAVHPGLAQHGAGLLVADCQQMNGLPIGTGVAGAAYGLAVHRQRTLPAPGRRRRRRGGQPRRQPRPHRTVQRARVHPLQDPADGGLIRRRLKTPGQRVTANAQQGQNVRRRVRHPFADRGERPRPRQHGRHRGQ
jgi:hypothetical protein